MLEYVGHFENTNLLNGNVGLAAHNRGYPINYFARLKELEFGDEIIYKQGYETKKYVVNNITIYKLVIPSRYRREYNNINNMCREQTYTKTLYSRNRN
mgnify:CR=1 FL=1